MSIIAIVKGLKKKQGSVATATERVTNKQRNNTGKNYKSDAHMVSVLPLLCYTCDCEVLWFSKVRYFCEVLGYRLGCHILVSMEFELSPQKAFKGLIY